MSILEALQILGSKGLITPDGAREVCTTVGVDFDEKLVKHWELKEGEEVTFFRKNGYIPARYGKGEGVDVLDLSYYIADKLQLRNDRGHLPGEQFTGAGFQAKANMRAIAQELSRRGIA